MISTDELLKNLSEYLNTEEGKETLQALNASLGSSSENPLNDDLLSSFSKSDKDQDDTFSFDPAMLGSILGLLNSGSDNKNADLIKSIKPYLSDKRKEKADSALKILKLLSILPLLRESGILSSLL